MINQQQQQRQATSRVYTHQLPYAVRRDFCNLLDADQSWRTLGGQYIDLDATQLSLIGQAYLAKGSPTEELLSRLDSANFRIAELCFYLNQMNHYRALDLLRPYAAEGGNVSVVAPQSGYCSNAGMRDLSKNSTLDTPTPSFAEEPAAIMGYVNTFDGSNNLMGAQKRLEPDNMLMLGGQEEEEEAERRQPIQVGERDWLMADGGGGGGCHRLMPTPVTAAQSIAENNNKQEDQNSTAHHDPGEEIVRMACANNRKRTSISDQEVVNQLRLIMQINYSELKQASEDFSDSKILGNGGFASVYRGNWKGTEVAIKRLKCNLMDQALNELTILNSYRIDNILPIYGISIDGPEACLVYQFMANGSLEDRLSCKRATPPLTWNQRAMIGEGVAKGLYYLHTLRDKPLVHGDVKSANVLLDSQFVPKLGDFGLARQVFQGKNPQTDLCTHCTVSSIHGTSVYLPPEYLRHKILSSAVDVYTYGIVLLEMATGKRAYDGKRLLIDLVEEEMRFSMATGQISYNLKDFRLADDTQSDFKIWYELLIKLGLNCAHKIKKKRPDMGEVLNRFAQFKNNSQSNPQANNNPISYTNAPNGGSSNEAMRNGSVTPTTGGVNDLNRATDMAREDFARDAKQNAKPAPQRQPSGFKSSNLNSLALMSVEEESEMRYFGDVMEETQDQQQQQDPSKPKDCSVEAMIPLLTELGVVTGDQD